MKNTGSGKGDRYRPVDYKKWDAAWSHIEAMRILSLSDADLVEIEEAEESQN